MWKGKKIFSEKTSHTLAESYLLAGWGGGGGEMCPEPPVQVLEFIPAPPFSTHVISGKLGREYGT